MNLNEFTQFFENPKVSVFSRDAQKDFDLKIGPWYPAYWDLLSFGNSAKGTSGHKMRLAPLLAPTYSDLRFQEHTGIVPLRVIIEDYENKFNYAKNRDGASLPHFTRGEYIRLIRAMLNTGISLEGSLLDFLGFPVFADVYKSFLASWDTFRMTYHKDEYSNYGFKLDQSISFDTATAIINSPSKISFQGKFDYRGSSYHFNREDLDRPGRQELLPLVLWLVSQKYGSILYSDIMNFYASIPSARRAVIYTDPEQYNPEYGINPTYIPTSDELVAASSFEDVQSMMNNYILYVYSFALYRYLRSFSTTDSSEQKVYTTLPLRAYWRLHFDWNVNGNFIDRDYFLDKIYNFEAFINSTVSGVLNDSSAVEIPGSPKAILREYMTPVNRMWDFDFFTNLLPTAAADDAIEIPANATVLNLASLTAMQKLVLKLSYSSRYRDVVWNLFKIKPSDARLQQSSIIRQKTHNVGIGETIQTSETTTSSVLGNFAGRGYSSGLNKGYHIFCEEPCVLINFVSLVPRASYADALHPLIHVDDILDFPIPGMDVMGNQPITADLVSGNFADESTVIGYGRQYQEWLHMYNTVHGNFKTTLDYWQLTRRFNDSAPVINDDFLRIHPADDLDQIFSVPDAPHAMLSIYYNAKVSRHVHRSVRIQI